MAKAKQIINKRIELSDGRILQQVIYQLPESTEERPHRLKYRLHCGLPGTCIVRYDNETGKGDHRHYGDREEPYQFVSLQQLIQDFVADVERLSGDIR